ncbi:PREDICTED: keratin, type II cuticular Hb1-like [Chinchilla lanigera]|uniref:keratin, type II cuticular Hb1-like n=1 Tax=Chinchilla lanigera TaxID=34839 RepID=UPI0006962FD2|nr:PREDICTED: keratin, type II cuticular Hb1-like [Chinchilla lanigera]
MCEEIKATVQKQTQSPRHSKEDLNRLNQAIQQLMVEVDGTKDQPCELEKARDLEALQAEGASCSPKDKLAWLEAALQRTKQDIATQLREYQELMIIKLGLDFEIATYRKLLEESRLDMEFGARSVAPGSALARRPSSASGPIHPPEPGAGSGHLDTSAPGGGCALCSSPVCAEELEAAAAASTDADRFQEPPFLL